jgi:hypothetical protein
MIRLSEDQIKEVASTLDCGLTCFIDRKTGKVNNVLNIENWDVADDVPLENILRDSGKKWYNYLEIRPMPPRDAFKIMESFVETVDNLELRDKLIDSLRNKHPFKNFRWIIDRSEEYLQKWLDFKSIEYIAWVKDYLYKLYSTEK